MVERPVEGDWAAVVVHDEMHGLARDDARDPLAESPRVVFGAVACGGGPIREAEAEMIRRQHPRVVRARRR